MTLIELERKVAEARREWLKVAPFRYSTDSAKAATERKARAEMSKASTLYRKAYCAWERSEKAEAADRQELSYPSFM